MSEIKEISDEAIKLALRCIEGGLSEVQFRYIIKTKNLDPNEVVAAVRLIESAKTRYTIWKCIHIFVVVFILSQIIIRFL